MKDLHSHILFGVDDGSKTLEESISILKRLNSSGVTDIILTPHYIKSSNYTTNNKEKEKKFQELKNKLKEAKIDINIYLGNEVFFTDAFLELLEREEIKTLNNSRYLLFEFPVGQVSKYTSEVISNIIANGYIPILAHPERYPRFQEHPQVIEEYLRMGVLLQGNYLSLYGKYGNKAKKTLKILLRKKQISFLGSDIHHEEKINIKKLINKIESLTKDKEYTQKILVENFDKVINNLDIGILR